MPLQVIPAKQFTPDLLTLEEVPENIPKASLRCHKAEGKRHKNPGNHLGKVSGILIFSFHIFHGTEVVCTEGHYFAIVIDMQAAASEPFDVQIHGILKGHG